MTRCIPFSVICILSQSGMTSDGYRRGFVSFAHFCYFFFFFFFFFFFVLIPDFFLFSPLFLSLFFLSLPVSFFSPSSLVTLFWFERGCDSKITG